MFVGVWLAWTAQAAPALEADRDWDVLQPGPLPAQMAQAADCRWERRSVKLSEVPLKRALFRRLAAQMKDEPPVRVLRETLARPVDPKDFARFVDDLCRALQRASPDGAGWTVPSGRARGHGILLHPREVYRDRAVPYAAKPGTRVRLDPVPDHRDLPRIEDGAPVGPAWARRYLEPESDGEKLKALQVENPPFARRVRALIRQLRAAGAVVYVESAVRSRHRGYLLYGSHWLGSARSEPEARARIAKLRAYNRKWGLLVPIEWNHPDGWEASVEQAALLADTYGVDYATVRGARRSLHYDGKAIDFVAVGLPRVLRLRAPDGTEATFRLDDPQESRDLSLTPQLVDWVEKHFRLRKLRRDYPHWSDPR
ncbi:MAG TPA: hypothetical protein RMG48_10090 [Myxococcales bacterium LLY-WYZ-16_1]|jgi:hypothetical protein|nr:hypothetical protein [Myxococcales bacterium LLY-WYZ-16_1]